MSVSDVNSDGLDDLTVCEFSRGQRYITYHIYLQTKGGMLEKKPITIEGIRRSYREWVMDNNIEEIAAGLCDEYFHEGIQPEEIDIKGFKEDIFKHFSTPLWKTPEELIKAKPEELEEIVLEAIDAVYKKREEQFTPEMMRQVEKWIFLRVQDELWKDHLLDMDHLREGIGLRGYAQQDPLREYQKEAYDLFLQLDSRLKIEFIEKLFAAQIMPKEEMQEQEQPKNLTLGRGSETGQQDKTPTKRKQPKVGRNEPCPCGSGKKYKKCCGK